MWKKVTFLSLMVVLGHFVWANETTAMNSVYQYSVPVGAARAYLWVPPDCRQVRGVMMAIANGLERHWLEDPDVRKTASDECLGILWLGPGPEGNRIAVMDADGTATLNKMFQDLADVSGLKEIVSTPLIPTGHSAHGMFAWNFAKAMPERTIAAIPIKTYPLPPDLDIPGIPMLYMVGETTEWPQYPDGRRGDRNFFWPVVRDSAVVLRTADRNNLVGVVTDPGGGHFDWSQKQGKFLALYIRKACEYRLPPRGSPGTIVLRPVRPESGWLTDTGGVDPDKLAPAPYARYKGDAAKAYWFFDEQMVRAAVAFDGDRRRRNPQMLSFEQDGQSLAVAKLGYAPLRFQPDADGITFHVKGTFLDEYPPELVQAGEKLTHAAGPIHFYVYEGPATQVGLDTFQVEFHRGDTDGHIWIEAVQDGDAAFRRAVQPGQMTIPAKLTAGIPQHITFAPIGDQHLATHEVELKATSDSGLPVRFFVVSGPAEIEGNTLRFTGFPSVSHLPIKVIVTAYQWGRMSAPSCQSAETVEQSFLLSR
jgi:hypothetical protein